MFSFPKSSIILVRGQSSDVRDWVVSTFVKVSLLNGFSRQVSSKKKKKVQFTGTPIHDFEYKKPRF